MARRAPPTQVCFLYIAQTHQILHSLPIAVALAKGWPQFEVHLAATSQDQLDYIDAVLARLGGAPVRTVLLGPAWLRAVRLNGASAPPKAAMLVANLGRLAGYGAVVTPERTTALVRRLGVTGPKLVYTQHGAGDRGGPFEPRLRQFDLVMAAGPKQRDRMVESGLVRPENCAMVGYPKFDIVEALTPQPSSPFADDRPVVVYNPHFDPRLSSWPRWGLRVLQQFAANDRYNLIFAPHIRLFDEAPAADREALAPFADHPRIHIDLGGPAAIDMTYTRCADLYLGDVSSQIYEFLRQPRPAVFLNAHAVDWRGDESYLHWTYGPVLDSPEGLLDQLDAAMAGHAAYLAAQQAGFAASFDIQTRPSSERAAEAIARLLGAGQGAA
ncbi:glycerophosphotransferase [Phenylobacterium sp.]|uniref:glycerophosphotransferase n=1 Tax=Phenylobacterium sp. TaxID=1871053 RepID=UPI0027305149|nr:glycerophosphotransferase [Phenylobacterium sp.]MDP1618451.1 glycerophosphotransferase [Phenylobacterium sp.]MDP1988056.1 glycerophosphotransferase [Phenylobacterium sp.]